MPKSVTVRLVGGLGNQLFCYYAGAALAAHHGVPLRLDTSWARHGMTDHGIEILRLDLPGEWLKNDRLKAKLSFPGTFPARSIDKGLRAIPVLGKPFGVHHARGVGRDPLLLRQPPGTRLRGYFQSWDTVESAVRAGYPRRPRLKHPDPWLDETKQVALREEPIAVHVRRGDYAQIPDFGLLGPSYYEPAIGALRELGLSGPIWLFSDDPQLATQALGRYAAQARLIASPHGPSSEMLAMSFASGAVIANSTFGWWGAWMGGLEVPVVAPRPWFKSGGEIDGLLPPSWRRMSR